MSLKAVRLHLELYWSYIRAILELYGGNIWRPELEKSEVQGQLSK